MEDGLNFKAVLLSWFNNKNLKNKWFWHIRDWPSFLFSFPIILKCKNISLVAIALIKCDNMRLSFLLHPTTFLAHLPASNRRPLYFIIPQLPVSWSLSLTKKQPLLSFVFSWKDTKPLDFKGRFQIDSWKFSFCCCWKRWKLQ